MDSRLASTQKNLSSCMPSSRRLAAIMFTDIVGYTAMMGEDEKKAFEVIKQNRKLQKPLIEEFGGVWVKELGDGVLATFPTVIDAVSCACLIIRGAKEIEGITLRIGIHLGDVIFENNDVFGDSVNIAARIQAQAPIGGIYITEAVHKNISNKKGIQSTYVKDIPLKNVKEPVPVYEVDIDSFHHDKSEHIKSRSSDMSGEFLSSGKRKITPKKILTWGIPVLLLGLALSLLLPPWLKKQHARNTILPQIAKLTENQFGILVPTKAFDLAKEADRVIPDDSALLKLWPLVAQKTSFKTEPAGASVYWKDYNDAKSEWKLLGKTPVEDIWYPIAFTRIKIEKEGFIPIYSPASRTLTLDRNGSYPNTMVKVPGNTARMNIVGLEQHGGKFVCSYLIDKFEVSHKEYKVFVDAGGYKEVKYWDQPFISETNELSPGEAMKLFIDKTGRPGPSTWEVGTYPDGKENHPVTGISWYEAMAYAKWAGKKLPTVYQWSLVANTINTWGIIPKSNFNGTGTVAVGSLDGISTWGVYDIAGNAREWCLNESNKRGDRFILGGGFNDPTYAYNDGYIQSVMDRSVSNGFRCVKELPGDTTIASTSGKLEFAFRDYKLEKPVDENTFNIFLRQFAYDRSPLNAASTIVKDTTYWKVEKIDMNAAYNSDRLTTYLFVPKNFSPPYQTVVFFPGSGVIYERKFNTERVTRSFDFILKSGRAVLYPVLKGTFERGDELNSDLQEETKFYKDRVIYWSQDLGRALDYLDTRKDITHDKYGYYGFSWGSAMGPVMTVVDKRFKAAVYLVGGMMMQKTLPEVDPLHFLPRVKIPTLMLNGRNDTFFPLETSQKPMFNLLGTPEKDKKIIIYEGGHLVPKSELMKESLRWFDQYLGPVK
jgi:class 3 adenylate cyclase/formylglycine-generating enzyme required for sulfatase activity/dienelactone hydrolase